MLDRVLGAWLHTRAVQAGGRLVIAIDGKAVRGAKDKTGKAPHLVAALAHGIGAVLGQAAVDAKSNEIPANLAANLAADLAAWIRLLGLYDCDDLNDAEPGTLRCRLLSLPARLVRHARARTLKISRTLALEGGVPGLLAAAVRPARTRLTSHSVPATGKEAAPARSEPVPSRAHRAAPSPASQLPLPKTGTTPSVTDLAAP